MQHLKSGFEDWMILVSIFLRRDAWLYNFHIIYHNYYIWFTGHWNYDILFLNIINLIYLWLEVYTQNIITLFVYNLAITLNQFVSLPSFQMFCFPENWHFQKINNLFLNTQPDTRSLLSAVCLVKKIFHEVPLNQVGYQKKYSVCFI